MHKAHLLLLGGLVSASLFQPVAMANYYTNGTWSTSPDEGNREIYGDSVEDYSGTSSANLHNCTAGLEKFIDKMENIGYTRWQYSTDEDAWSKDFEASGLEDLYGDAGDFGYFSGHGGGGYAKYNGDLGDNYLYDTETEYGDNDMEFMAYDSCNTVNAAARTDYITQNQGRGVHYIFGFQTTSIDVTTTAKNYGKYMKDGYTVRNAWISATMDGHPSSKTGAYVRFYNSSCDTFSETATAFACDPKTSPSSVEYTWSL